VTVRLEVYSEQSISQRLGEKLTEILSVLLEILALAHKEVKQGRLVSYGKTLLGSVSGKEAMERFIRLVQVETALVNAETLSQVKEGFAQVNSDLRKLSRQLDETRLRDEEDSQEDLSKKLRALLRPCSSSEDRYRAMARGRVSGTGEWLQEMSDFIDWVNGVKPVLWISGNPGAGKSYLATSVLNYLETLDSVGSRGFFFFKDDDATTRSVHQGLRDVAFQIAQSDRVYAEYVCSCIDSPEDIPKAQSLWRKLFAEVFATGGKSNGLNKKRASERAVFLVLDALDEAFSDDRAELFELLKDVQEGGRMRVLMLGRPQIADEMNELMDLLKVQTIHVSKENNFEDIVHYIKTGIKKSVFMRKLPGSIQRQIVQRLSTDSQGMFLWVSLMIQELSRIRNKGDIQKKLSEAPKGLSKMIYHVLKGVSESLADNHHFAEDFNEILAWVVCAPRPLNLREIENLLKWRSPEGEGWIWLEGSFRVQFASIFTLIREDGLSTADLKRIPRGKMFVDIEQSKDYDSDESDCFDETAYFDSDPKTTTITFAHASLGEFFRSQEEMIQAGPECPYIGIDHLEAKQLVLLRCFEMFGGYESSRDDIVLALRPFACRSLVQILQSIDKDELPSSERDVIGFSLALMLTQETPLESILDDLHFDFFDEGPMNTFRSWLDNQEVLDMLGRRFPDGSAKSWLQDALNGHPAELFRPMADHLASNTLYQPAWVIGCNFPHLLKFLNLWTDWSSKTAKEKTFEIANWGQPEKNAAWHKMVATMLLLIEESSHGIDHLKIAIEMDPDDLTIRHNLAMLYWVDGSTKTEDADLKRVIELCQINTHELQQRAETEENRALLHTEYEALADCYLKLEDFETAVEMFRTARHWNDSCTDCIEGIANGYKMAATPDKTATFLQELHSQFPDKDGLNHLVNFLLETRSLDDVMNPELELIISRNGCHPQITQALTEASRLAHSRDRPVLAARLALKLAFLLHSLGEEPDRAFQICEQVLHTYRPSQAHISLVNDLENAMHLLSIHYIRQCLQPDCSQAEREQYGEALENLTVSLQSSRRSGRDRTYTPSFQMRLFLAIYYQICERNDDALQYFSPLLEKTAYGLQEDGDSDDWKNVIDLLKVLLAMHDLKNATAVVYHAEYLRRAIKFDFDNSIPASYCDGCAEPRTMDGMAMSCYYHISQCVSLCETCFSGLKAGVLKLSVCDASDDFLVIPPRPKEVKERTDEHRSMLFVEGNWMTLENFKLHLKRQYGLS
jgi:tetratricopeptide (TPR) repeat protein